MSVLSVFVAGIPAPAGSKTGFPIRRKNGTIGVAITDASKRAKPWKATVAASVGNTWAAPPLDCALSVELLFTMPRIKAHYRKQRCLQVLRDNAPLCHTTTADVDKLIRAVFDGLKGIVWTDDARISSVFADKRYGDRPGVQITVRRAI